MLHGTSRARCARTVLLAAAVSLTAAASAQADYAADVLATPGLQSYWKLADTGATAADSKGGRTLTFAGTAGQGYTRGRPSLVSGAGTSTDVTAARATGPDVYDFAGTAPFTVEAWVSPDGRQLRSRFIAAKYGTAGGWYLSLDKNVANRVIFARVAGGTGGSTVLAGGVLTDGTASHVVASYDGTTMRISINGTLSSSVASAVSLPDTTVPVSLGGQQYSGSDWDGGLDDTAIYSTALPTATVSAHATSGRRGGAPARTGAAAISGTVTPGTTVTSGTGTWSGSPTSYAYRWQRCAVNGTACATIPGATGASYVVTSADSGLVLRTLVSATNASGTGTLASLDTRNYQASVLSDAPVLYHRFNDAVGATSAASSGSVARPLIPVPASSTCSGAMAPFVFVNEVSATRGYRAASFGGTTCLWSSSQLPPAGLGNGISAEAWVRPSSGTNGQSTIVGATLGSAANAYLMRIGTTVDGKWYVQGMDQNGVPRVVTFVAGPTSAGATYHVVGVFAAPVPQAPDTSVLALYVNGVLQGTQSFTGVRPYAPTTNWWQRVGEGWKGYIDEPAVYTKTLLAPRVVAHYNAGQ